MIQQKKKKTLNQNVDTPKKTLKLSRTWNNQSNHSISHPPKCHQSGKIISSQPEIQKNTEPILEKEKIELIGQVQNLLPIPFLLIDKNFKPIIYNIAFEEAFLNQNTISIEYAIRNIKVFKLDKISQKLVRSIFRETYNQKQLIRSLSQQNTYPLHSVSSKPIRIQFSHIMQIINQQHNHCIIVEHQSQLFTNEYQIEIKYNSGYFMFLFSRVDERDNYKQKINTKILMNQLFKSLSHEFSTSLNCIQILAENALEELPQETVTKYIQPLLNSCYILNSIVQDVKDFSLILSKNFTLTIKNTNILSLINDVSQLFQSQLKMKGLEFILDAQNIYVHTDAQRVRQSLINLLSNAQKFTQKGSIKIIACSEIIKEQRFVKILVEDTGPGIEQEIQNQLRQFLKTNTKNKFREKNQSYGMGLLITEKIVKGLTLIIEGGIHFESNNLGTKFWFYVEDLQSFQITNQNSKQTIKYKQMNSIYSLSRFEPSFPLSPCMQDQKLSLSPLCSVKFNRESQKFLFNQSISISFSENLSFQDERNDQITNPYIMKQAFSRQKKSLSELTTNHFKETKILIVDDEFVNIYALKIMLNRLNYLCDTASNGGDAFDQFISNQYYLIFMDIEMPIMNGIQATKSILSFCELNNIQKPIVIAQTAYTDLLTKQLCLDCGMQHFLHKPIRTDEIKTILSDFM